MKKLIALLLFAATSLSFGSTTHAQTAQIENRTSIVEAEPKGSGYIVTPGGETVVFDDSDTTEPRRSAFQLFMEGDWVVMSIITLILVAIFFAAWKAPAWVKELGLLALTIGFGYFMIGIYGVSDVVANTAIHISQHILCAGLRVALIAPLYGLFVYGVSLVVRIVQKPRLE